MIASTREAFELYARYFVDSFHLPVLSDEEILSRVECDTAYRLREGLDGGHGGICALPHLGNWDAAGRWLLALGIPVLAVAEELKPRRLFDLFVEHRRVLGMDMVSLSANNVGEPADRRPQAESPDRAGGGSRFQRQGHRSGDVRAHAPDPRRSGVALPFDRGADHRHADLHHTRRMAHPHR